MNETVKNLVERKSCRKFKPEHITRQELDDILAAGRTAPSGMNRQPALLVAVLDEETVAQLSKMNAAVAGMPFDPFYGAKDVIIVLAKKEGTYLYDGSLAMGNLLNAAWSMGIDCRWIHRAKEVFASPDGQALLEKWGVPGNVEGIGFCILGHAAEEKPKTEIQPNRVFYV
ncbi:MAG: nitroreductase family protein [Firmicutes bacterium]|nr:nitroreductase family protein [Bacillota bacterium]